MEPSAVRGHQIGPAVDNLRLFGRQVFRDFSSKETAAENTVSFTQEEFFQRYVVAMSHTGPSRLVKVIDALNQGAEYGYDFEDRLQSASAGDSFVYDGDGNRVSRTASGATTGFLVDDQTPPGYAQVAEEVVAGSVAAQHTHGPLRISQKRGTTVSYYGYGDGRAYYLRVRWYRPTAGRFLTADKWESSGSESCNCIVPNIPEPGVGDTEHYPQNLAYGGSDASIIGRGMIEQYIRLRYWRSATGSDRGLEFHHLTPKRFACVLGVLIGEMLVIALAAGFHQLFDNEWARPFLRTVDRVKYHFHK